MLESRGDFLHDKGDDFIKKLAWARSVAGLVILAGIALTYPGFTKPTPELVTVFAHDPADVAAISKLTGTWLDSVLYGLAISLLCIVLFAVFIVASARSDQRLVMLRRMGRPFITFALAAALMVTLFGAIDLYGSVSAPLEQHATQQNSDPQGSLLIIALDVVILVILSVAFIVIVPVLYVKIIYLAAVDVFRADDAHPLLAPFATTVAAWSLASFALIGGGPTGVPYRFGLLILFGGPLSVSVINAWACCRLWRNYHDLLFRGGPLAAGRAVTPAPAPGDTIRRVSIAGVVMAIGPAALGLILLVNYLVVPPKISGPVRLGWTYLTGNYVSSPAVAGGTVYFGSFDHKVYALDAATGRLRWSYTTGDYVNSSPAVAGGIVYVGSNDDRVYALDAATGRLRWYYTTGDSVISKPAVGGNNVYVGSSDKMVYALDAAG